MIKYGIVGTSWITDAFIKSSEDVEDFQLNAIYSRSMEKAKEFGFKYGVNHYFDDLNKMATSKEIDAVYIASPNAFHYEQTMLFLENKKHVICEKPLASNALQVEKMVEKARENGVVLMEAFKTNFLPNFKVVEENIHKLGKIRRYTSTYCQYSSKYDAFKDGKILNAFELQCSSGSLMDLGVYCIQPMIKLFGYPHEILSSVVKLHTGVDGSGSIIAKYDDMEGVITHSKITNSFQPTEIQGEKGTLTIDHINKMEKIQLLFTDGRVEDITVPQRLDTMYYEIKEFAQWITKGKGEAYINTHQQSLLSMRLMDEVRKQNQIIYSGDY